MWMVESSPVLLLQPRGTGQIWDWGLWWAGGSSRFMLVLSPWAPGSQRTGGGHSLQKHHKPRSLWLRLRIRVFLQGDKCVKGLFVRLNKTLQNICIVKCPSCSGRGSWGCPALTSGQLKCEKCRVLHPVMAGPLGSSKRQRWVCYGVTQTSGCDLSGCIRRESTRIGINHLSGTSDKTVIMPLFVHIHTDTN